MLGPESLKISFGAAVMPRSSLDLRDFLNGEIDRRGDPESRL